jgi:hypothetical protein
MTGKNLILFEHSGSEECTASVRKSVRGPSIQGHREGVIKKRMRLGDLLIQAKMVTPDDLANALAIQSERGGRLGSLLVASGAITQQKLEAFIHRMPAEPHDIAATKIDPIDLLSLLVRMIYVEHLETVREFIDTIKLPYNIVTDLVQMAVDRKLFQTMDRATRTAFSTQNLHSLKRASVGQRML